MGRVLLERGEASKIPNLELNPRFGHSSERCRLPVGLLSLLPHHHVEGGRILVAEDETGVVVIGHCVDVERAFKVHTAESSVTWVQKMKKEESD